MYHNYNEDENEHLLRTTPGYEALIFVESNTTKLAIEPRLVKEYFIEDGEEHYKFRYYFYVLIWNDITDKWQAKFIHGGKPVEYPRFKTLRSAYKYVNRLIDDNYFYMEL